MVDPLNEQNHEDLDSLQNYVDAVLNDPPEEEWCLAARRRLQDSLESKEKENWMMSMIKNGLSGKLRWAVAAAIAVAVIVVAGELIPWGNGSGRAYAAAADRLRKAQTMTYTTIIKIKGLPEIAKALQEMQTDTAYKDPGLVMQKIKIGWMESYGVTDLIHNRQLNVWPSQKQYALVDLSKMPDEMRKANTIEKFRNLPEKADEVLAQREMNGKQVIGFRVTEEGMNKIIWSDPRTGEPVRVEATFVIDPNVHIVMDNFKFDVPLDDNLFSLTPPAGYKELKISAEMMSPPNEQELIETLRFLATDANQGTFPKGLSPTDSINDMLIKNYERARDMSSRARMAKKPKPNGEPPMTAADLNKALEKARETNAADLDKALEKAKEKAGKTKIDEAEMKKMLAMTRGLMFAMQMKPENDWHYIGAGVKLDDAASAVCYWKPTGATNYRVVYGDLSIRDATADEVAALLAKSPKPKTKQ